MASHIGRRKFLATLGGAAAAWPLAARGQQPAARLRRIGILMPYAERDAEYAGRVLALRQELARLGWTEGANAPSSAGQVFSMMRAVAQGGLTFSGKPGNALQLAGL
jgi:hypothetical protein